ncbi:superoxide dismutase, Ni [Desulfobacula sp.]|uniref:superoxide dismutase, Ni n=1 Tax=Desulfobacula sp. TaxID=2593537 RepID=UPI0026150330|nr:superoxide dismutase, Ni [Desulfobacula sp.]
MKKVWFKKMLVSVLAVWGLTIAFFLTTASAHCQIPCGIYNDAARVDQMLEDTATVLKSCKLIATLSGKTDAQSQNQLVRWVMNKEVHAQRVIATISDYFLTQRVKTSQTDYVERLKKHHAVIVAAMAAKQNADEKYALALQKTLEALAPYYSHH